MNNDDLLKQMEKLFEAEREQTRRLIREENEPVRKDIAGLKQDVERVELKAEAINHKLDTTATEIKEEIEQVIEREAKATADTFFDAFEKLDKQEDHEKRIKLLEQHTGIHKN